MNLASAWMDGSPCRAYLKEALGPPLPFLSSLYGCMPLAKVFLAEVSIVEGIGAAPASIEGE